MHCGITLYYVADVGIGHRSFSEMFEKMRRERTWEPLEDQLLREGVQKHGVDKWRHVERDMAQHNLRAVDPKYVKRSAAACMFRWIGFLSPTAKSGKWTPDVSSSCYIDLTAVAQEDAKLTSLMNEHRERALNFRWPWSAIAKSMNGRSAISCRNRYVTSAIIDSVDMVFRWKQCIDPSLKKGPWSPEEDANLLDLVDRLRDEWTVVTSFMGGRSYNAVRHRFHFLTKEEPQRIPWSTEEDEALTRAVAELGTRKWKAVAEALPNIGRDSGQCAARWSYLLVKKGYADPNWPPEVSAWLCK